MAKTNYTSTIQQVANQFGLPFALLEAQVVQESSGQPDAFRFEHGYYIAYIKNNPNAKAAKYGPLAACSFGLLQIMFETAVEGGFAGRPEDLFVPLTGLQVGARYLTSLLDGAKNDYRKALASYNGGPHLLDLTEPNWPAGPTAYVNAIYRIAGVQA